MAVLAWMAFNPGSRPQHDLPGSFVLTPDKKSVYFSDDVAQAITIYGLDTGEAHASIALTGASGGIVFSPDGARAYALTMKKSQRLGCGYESSVVVIETAT